MARKKKEPLKVFNGTLDITEKDIARQNYYRLLSEQSARNIVQSPQPGGMMRLFFCIHAILRTKSI